MIDWRDVAKIIAPLAPAAGSILGGFIPFPGGSLIGQKFGELIAKQFGVAATPEALHAAVTGNPNEVVLAKIAAAMEQARAGIEGFTEIERAWAEVAAKSIVEVNETMRAEIGREHPFYTGWRPACGWGLAGNAAAFGIMLNVAAAMAAFYSKAEPLKILVDAWPIFLAYFGALGMVVGVAILGRSQEKSTAIASGAVMPNATPTKPPAKGR